MDEALEQGMDLFMTGLLWMVIPFMVVGALLLAALGLPVVLYRRLRRNTPRQ